MARSIKEVHTINYYPINEGAARRAKEMNSFSDYKEGSATAEYRAMVDKAAAIAEKQKSRVDPMYHEKIDHLLDTYARKLAENMNQGFAIDARVPSVLIAGPSNFPVGKKEKQNRARDSNMEEWRHIQGLLDKIRSTGMGGISADDPAAIELRRKVMSGQGNAEEKMQFEQQKAQRTLDLLAAGDDELFEFKQPDFSLPERARIFDSFPCAQCGETTMEPRLRLVEGKKLCLSCSQPYHRGW